MKESELTSKIIKAVSQHPGCLLDEVVTDCPHYTWNQVFLQVDQMSRNGQIRLARSKNGHYSLWLPREENMDENKSVRPKRGKA